MFKLLFVILALFLIMLAISKCKFTESFANTPVAITSDNVADYIYTVYKADVKAIQNLADIAMKLQAGGVTVPGTMTISNQLNVTNATLLSNTLEVKGAATLDSTLAVTGTATINGNITGPTITDLYKQITDLQARCVALETKTSSLSGNGNSATFSGTLQVNNKFIARGGIIQIGPNPNVYIRCGTEVWSQPSDPYVLAAAGKWNQAGSDRRVDSILIHSDHHNLSLELTENDNQNFNDVGIIWHDDWDRNFIERSAH